MFQVVYEKLILIVTFNYIYYEQIEVDSLIDFENKNVCIENF